MATTELKSSSCFCVSCASKRFGTRAPRQMLQVGGKEAWRLAITLPTNTSVHSSQQACPLKHETLATNSGSNSDAQTQHATTVSFCFLVDAIGK